MDFLVDDHEDLVITNGDLAISPDSRLQEARAILVTSPGNWKQFPLVGVGEDAFIEGPITAELRRTIALQMQSDGKQLRGLKLTPNGTLKMDVE